MSVNVEYSLPSGSSIIEDEPKLAVRVLLRKTLRHSYHLGEKIRFGSSELCDVCVLRCFRNHEEVNRCLWCNVLKRDDALRLNQKLGRDFAGDNFSKNS